MCPIRTQPRSLQPIGCLYGLNAETSSRSDFFRDLEEPMAHLTLLGPLAVVFLRFLFLSNPVMEMGVFALKAGVDGPRSSTSSPITGKLSSAQTVGPVCRQAELSQQEVDKL